MGNHSNYKEEKCWSCAFFCGNRKESKSFLFGDCVETSSSGKCLCEKSSYYNKSVFDEYRCSSYQRWAGIDALIFKQEKAKLLKEQKKESERIQREQDALREREWELNWQKSAEERREKERAKREQFLDTLTKEEREAFLQHEKEETERKIKDDCKKTWISTINDEIQRKKRSPIKVAIIGTLVTLVLFLIGWFPYYLYSADIEINEKFLKDAMDYADDPVYQHYYQQTQIDKAKQSECIWIPLTILFIGLLITGILCFLKCKKNKIEIEELKKELNELEAK